MKLINPPRLKEGETIGIVAPSAGIAKLFPHRAENGKSMLEELGFKVKFAENSLEMEGWVSATPQKRADDMNKMFADKDIKAIICMTGGDHSNQLLKLLDYDLIRKNPKIFMGYSDITVLHYAITEKTKLRTFYGPCLMPEFGEFPTILPYTLDFFKKAVMESEPIGRITPSDEWTDEFLNWFAKDDLTRARKMQKNSGYEWWREGNAEAEIFGGTIPSINHLAGTEYWVSLRGKILFIDLPEGDEPGGSYPLSHLDSHLADLENLGVFDHLQGLVIGRPYSYKPGDKEMLKQTLFQYIKNFDFPILFNANIGHAAPVITIPLGTKVRLNSENNEFSILESGVE